MIDLKPGEDPMNFNAGTPEPEPMEMPKAEKARKPKQKTIEVEPPTVIQGLVENPPADKGDPVKLSRMEEPEKQTVQKAAVHLNERGIAAPVDLDQAYRLANALFKGRAFPNWVKTPEQALAVSLFLKNLGLEVMTGIQHVCEVNGRITLWGEGPLAAVRASGKLKSIKEMFLTKDYKEICLKNKNLDADLFAAVCTMVRTDGEKIERAFTMKDAEKATQGITAIWKGYQRIMFKRKARAECIKDLFGDVVLGAGIAEYDFEQAPDMGSQQEGQARVPLAERLNQRVLEAPKDGEAVQD